MAEQQSRDWAALYHEHRRASDHAFRQGDGAECTGRALSAHICLQQYATQHNLAGTDAAAAHVRTHRKDLR